MNLRTTIIINAVALLGILAMFLTVRHSARTAGAGIAPRQFIESKQLPIDAINRIEVQRGDETMAFERRENDWFQVEPIEHPMDPYSIRQMMILASDATVTDTIDSNRRTLASVGFDPPRARLTFIWPDGSTAVELGRTGIAGRAYARVAGESAIAVIGSELHQRAVDMNPREWRDRQLFSGAGVESQRIEWSGSGQQLILERDGRTWNMLAPVTSRLDRAAVTGYVSDISRARHVGFILDLPKDLAQFGLDRPVGVLTITNSDGTTERLLVGERVGASTADRYGIVERRPVVVRLSEPVINALFMPAGQLIDPVGSGVNPADVKRIRVISQDQEFNLERDLDRWISPEYGDSRVSTAAVDDLLSKLTTVRASQVDVREFPRQLHVGTITFFDHNGRARDTVRIVHDPESDNWALENGDNVLRVFPPSFTVPFTAADFGLAAPGNSP